MTRPRVSSFFLFLASLFLGACESTPSSPRVEAVYPSSDTLAANLLRIYVTFSTPMKVQGNLEKIALLDGEGKAMEGAIFNNAYELWDNEQKQWTLLFDPGRVKTGLNAHEIHGRALTPGQSYQLVIQDLEDVNHRKMDRAFIKQFHVIDADTIPPSIEAWIITAPRARTRSPLVIMFPDALDQFSLRQRLILTNSQQEPISGQLELGENEKKWLYTPENSWVKGDYYLFVNSRLEDPSGNNLNGLFDHKSGSLKFKREGEILQQTIRVE